jgi:hypothetical protein
LLPDTLTICEEPLEEELLGAFVVGVRPLGDDANTAGTPGDDAEFPFADGEAGPADAEPGDEVEPVPPPKFASEPVAKLKGCEWLNDSGYGLIWLKGPDQYWLLS